MQNSWYALRLPLRTDAAKDLSRREISPQMKQRKPKMYRVYFEVSFVHRCGERSAGKMKKLPADSKVGREIFSEKSGQLVQPQGHAALLAGSSILVQNTLANSLVHSLDSQLVSGLSDGTVAALNSSVELLDGGLQLGLVSLVLLVSNLDTKDILLRGLNVGHWLHLLFPNLVYARTHYNAAFQ